MSQSFDYTEAQERIWASLEKNDYHKVVQELQTLLEFLELTSSTEYIDYLEYKFLLHQVYGELAEWPAALRVLRELNRHFLQKTNPRMLSAHGLELYIKTWTYLGYLLSESGNTQEAVETLQKSLPCILLLCGPESSEYEIVNWYIHSLLKYGRITSDEPESFMVHEEEGMLCSFCLTGQVDIVTGPSVCICAKCIARFSSFFKDSDYAKHLLLASNNARCSFACKPKEAALGLFPGPGVFICDSCLAACEDPGDDRRLP